MLSAAKYMEARATAVWHVQVELLEVAEGVETPGQVAVQGEIVRIFRSTPEIASGDKLVFEVSAILQRDEMPTGGTIWTDYARLRRVRFMEVFLNPLDSLPNCEVALWQSRLLDKPTNQPFFDS